MKQKTWLLMCVGGPYCGEELEVPYADSHIEFDNGMYLRTAMANVFPKHRHSAKLILLWQQPMFS